MSDFPLARMEQAQSLAEVFEAWEDAGLTPTEITEDQVIQTITVKNNLFKGELTWTSHKIGEQSVAVLIQAAYAAYRYWYKEPDRPQLTGGKVNIAIQQNGDKLQLMYSPEYDPIQIMTTLAAALFGLAEETKDNPPDRILGLLNLA